nr:MAG TPA: hypothetical protein [Caudoviricetes sp.]
MRATKVFVDRNLKKRLIRLHNGKVLPLPTMQFNKSF